MTRKGLSTVLALFSTCAVLFWTMSYTRSTQTPQVIKTVRGYSVLNLTWARVENWRKDLGEPPCAWTVKQTVPVIGSFEVDCVVKGKAWMRFDVSSDQKQVEPADAQTAERVSALTEWANKRKRYP